MIVAEQAKECTAALRCSARRGRLVDGQDIPPSTEKVCQSDGADRTEEPVRLKFDIVITICGFCRPFDVRFFPKSIAAAQASALFLTQRP
jgi:hypothetical protein